MYGIAVSYGMRTVSETPVFIRYAAEVWSEAERLEFISYIAANPEAGAVIRGSGGCRKVRWSRSGTGKRGGARVIYFEARDDVVWPRAEMHRPVMSPIRSVVRPRRWVMRRCV